MKSDTELYDKGSNLAHCAHSSHSLFEVVCSQ